MQAPAAAGNLALENLLLRNRPGGACSSAWLEPAAHNGLVAGSNPAGPTNTSFAPVRRSSRNRIFPVISMINGVLRSGSGRWHPADLLVHFTGSTNTSGKSTNKFLEARHAPNRCEIEV